MLFGRQEHALEGYDRFYATKLCYEYRLERDAAATHGLVEKHNLFVLYENPKTGKHVERLYQAAVANTEDDRMTVPWPYGCEKGDWDRVKFPAIKPSQKTAVIPKAVQKGEPANFRAVISVHPDETRLEDVE